VGNGLDSVGAGDGYCETTISTHLIDYLVEEDRFPVSYRGQHWAICRGFAMEGRALLGRECLCCHRHSFGRLPLRPPSRVSVSSDPQSHSKPSRCAITYTRSPVADSAPGP
jgi:hypothetical protein